MKLIWQTTALLFMLIGFMVSVAWIAAMQWWIKSVTLTGMIISWWLIYKFFRGIEARRAFHHTSVWHEVSHDRSANTEHWAN